MTGTAAALATATAWTPWLGKGCADNGLTLELTLQVWTIQHPIVLFGSNLQAKT